MGFLVYACKYIIMKEYPYKTIFATRIKPLVQQETDKYISMASSNFKHLFPNSIDFDKKVDFLGIYGNLCVANRLNSNDDGVSTKEALEIAESAPFSLIDLEHGRQNCIGVLTQASFASFGENKPLTKEQVKDLNEPFYVIVGGVIWKAVNPELAEYIENNGADSDEPVYLSWEVGFSEYNLIEIEGSKKNFEDGTLITDKEEISKLEKFLKAEGGRGVLSNGKKLGRVPINNVVLIGAALTASPAADVPPITAIASFKKSLEDGVKEGIANFKGFSDTETKESYSDKSDKIKNKSMQMEVQKVVKNETKTGESKDKVQSTQDKINTFNSNTIKTTNKDIPPKNPNYQFGVCPSCKKATDYKNFIESWSKEGVTTCETCGNASSSDNWKLLENMKSMENNEVILANHKESCEKNQNSEKNSVTNNSKLENNKSYMKINSLKDINDEILKECKASDIAEFVNSEIKKINEDFTKKQDDQKNLVDNTNKQFEELKASSTKAEKELAEVKASLQKVLDDNEKKALLDAFSARMATVDSEFELEENEKQILASKIKVIKTDEDFTKFLDETNILLAAKKKSKVKPSKDNKDPDKDGDDDTNKKGDKDKDFAGKDKKGMKQSKASDEIVKENIVENVINNGEKKAEIIANVIDNTTKPSLQERYAKNFGIENWTTENKKKNRQNQ